jgi:hypothetical protein
MSEELAVLSAEPTRLSIAEVREQIRSIQELMRGAMQEGQHFGVVPGTGDKPTLLKPGAEKISMMFRLAPEYEVEARDHPGCHREYQVRCTLRFIPTGQTVGQGLGAGSTMEGKYRYRWEDTGAEVPREYWDTRDPQILGGSTFVPRKTKAGGWHIYHRVEHDNPADYLNTILKMAKKRAHVDAVLTATAASDIFTQDIEDMTEVIAGAAKVERPPVAEPKAKVPVPTVSEDPPEFAASDDGLPPRGAPGTVVGQIEALAAPRKMERGTRYGMKVKGEWFNSFDTKIHEFAQHAKATNTAVRLTFDLNERGFRDILEISQAEE